MRLTILTLALLACGNTAPTADPHPPGYIEQTGELWLTVNGHEITSDMLEASTRLTPKSEIERLKKSGGWVQRVEQVGIGDVLYHDALEKGLDKDPMVHKAMMMAMREVLAQENFANQVTAQITEGTIRKYYEDRAVQYKRPQARARHILVREEAKAKELMAELEKGADFAKLVQENTLDPATKDKGGDLGFFNKNMLDPAIAEQVFTSELNKPFGPVETRFGFHIFEVLERRDLVPLEDVREEIEVKMRQEGAEKILTQLKADLVMKRHNELEEIYKKTSNWGSPENPMGHTPPPARPGTGPELPGVRKEDKKQAEPHQPGSH